MTDLNNSVDEIWKCGRCNLYFMFKFINYQLLLEIGRQGKLKLRRNCGLIAHFHIVISVNTYKQNFHPPWNIGTCYRCEDNRKQQIQIAWMIYAEMVTDGDPSINTETRCYQLKRSSLQKGYSAIVFNLNFIAAQWA
jgi:hypothetical protein